MYVFMCFYYFSKKKGGMVFMNNTKIPGWWISSNKGIQEFIETKVTRGKVGVLAVSPGKRNILSVTYGNEEPELKGTANFNSAIGSGNPDAYIRRGPGVRKHPVMIVVAGMHGQEVEGMVSALSLVSVMETGKDLSGREQPELYRKLENFRLIIIPVANPDGRERVPYDGWVGVNVEEMTKYGQGTRRNGELYRWRGSKAVHPMRGDVGILGGYFDDNGVNMMHDDWASPMSETTKALLKLTAAEGPDILLNLHSHSHDPSVLPPAYIPVTARLGLIRFRKLLYAKLESAGYICEKLPISFTDGMEGQIPPAFNLTSMLYHVGADISVTFETPHGVIEGEHPYGYDDILKIHNILFDSAADFLREP